MSLRTLRFTSGVKSVLALNTLMASTSLDVSVDVGPERYSSAVEGAAYFVISEALANVTKYAKATKALVRVRYFADHMTIEVEDDGIGGADPHAGRDDV